MEDMRGRMEKREKRDTERKREFDMMDRDGKSGVEKKKKPVQTKCTVLQFHSFQEKNLNNLFAKFG